MLAATLCRLARVICSCSADIYKHTWSKSVEWQLHGPRTSSLTCVCFNLENVIRVHLKIRHIVLNGGDVEIFRVRWVGHFVVDQLVHNNFAILQFFCW